MRDLIWDVHDHELKLSNRESKLSNRESRLVARESKLLPQERRMVQCDVIQNESRFQSEARVTYNDYRLVHHESRLSHELRHTHESRVFQHNHCESRTILNEHGVHHESRLAHHEHRLAHHESKLIQHESKLIQRQLYFKERARSRKMLLGSVVASDVGSEVGRSRPSSVYRQREVKCWLKHVVSTDSGYSGASQRQSEAEDSDLPTIIADVGPAVCLRLPTKCRKCRRYRSEMKDASSQHSPQPSDDSRPSSPLTETLLSFVVETPDVLALPPPDWIFQCRVVRDKNSFGTNFYPVYRMYLERDAKPERLLLVARKRKKCSTSKYLILTGCEDMSRRSEDMSRRSSRVVGKLRSNLVGTRFMLTTLTRKSDPTDSCLLFYETNILGTKGPRRMKVFLPENSEAPVDLLERYRRQAMDGVIQLVNKEPEWDKQTLSHVLYFEGRVTKSSVKNFQLCHPPEEEVLLQFGKIGRDEFTLDYQRPLNAVQAFAVALSSFDYKIACE
ncbi:hypothetical protein GE061_009308 [Apolygus lucorum]|uniref:Tubby C-terminal domain-containing protein n=1 Tax=Apolygus lucorum TaxID=248454 RepID=A0A6A4K6H7_APOLU|nr:hypothetical protein GE061_009308 [Apolygus lucorum]